MAAKSWLKTGHHSALDKKTGKKQSWLSLIPAISCLDELYQYRTQTMIYY